MHLFDGLLKDQYPAVFHPKVTPDPAETERLQARLEAASQQLRNGFSKRFAQRVQQMQGRDATFA